MAELVERIEPENQPTPPGRLAGIDYGSVRIGIALTDSRQTLASPLESYARQSPAADAAHFRNLATDEQLAAFVVGLPVHMDGRESAKSREAREFGRWLSAETGRPVLYFDERYTSVEAERRLNSAGLTKKRRKARLDAQAAQIMLTAFIEAHRASPPQGPGP